jgi:hypothetical protein
MPDSSTQTTSELDDVARRGLAIYEAQLKPLLEPDYNGQIVAIHVESGDHAVARFSGQAVRAIRKRHPTGQLLVRTIGKAMDYGLAHRMRGFRLLPGDETPGSG